MRHRLFSILACGILLAAGVRLGAADGGPGAGGSTPGPLPPPPTTAPTPAHDIALAIAQLGDDDPRVRDAATRKLSAMGRSALPALRHAADGDDPEAASRAKRILAEVRFGIGPDTPAALMRLVDQYRDGQGQSQQQAIEQLSKQGWPGYRIVARLFRQAGDSALRSLLSASLKTEGPNILGGAREMIAAGREDDAEARLAEAAGGGDGLVARSYVALLLARGRLEEGLQEVLAEAGEKPDASDAMLLAFFYRARGDADNALRYARQVPAEPGSDAEPLIREILLDRQDWAALIAQADRPAVEPSKQQSGAALSDKLSFARLSGDARSISEAVAAMRQAAAQSPELAIPYARALALNDRCAEGLDLLVKAKQYPLAYALMTSLGRYDDAARLLADARVQASPDLADLELNAARLLVPLGDIDGANAIVDRWEKEIPPDIGHPTQDDLIKTELVLGRTEKACQRAISAKTTWSETINGNTAAVAQVFQGDPSIDRILPAGGPDAVAWRAYLAARYPKATPAEVLQKLWSLYARQWAAADVESLLNEACHEAEKQKPADSAAVYRRAAETARTIGRDDLADMYFEKLAADPVASVAAGWYPWKVLGDRAAAKMDYPRALQCYENALQRSPREPVCLWLHGWAITRANAGDPDKVAKAKAEMRRADEYLLADDARWLSFLQSISEAGADATTDSEDQREIMRRLAGPASWESNESLRLSARAIFAPAGTSDEMEIPDDAEGSDRSGPRFLLAANLLSRWMLPISRGETALVAPELYLSEPALIHILRARGLIALGDVPAAIREAGLGLSCLPANVQLLIDLVPILDRQGHKPEADALFNEAAVALKANLSRHPKAAGEHNGLAWMCAKCDRDLDSALDHAKQATTLAPETVGYLDTLAEVRFCRGERQAAIEIMKHCLELDPHSQYFQHQLQRFTRESPPATQPK
jgi:hypothetical protein